MTTPKFKIGDRVKWKDHEGRARSGVIVELPFGCPAQFDTCFVREAQELQPGRWHESHLSLDVPELKKYATDLEVQLGIEIINLNRKCSNQDEANLWMSSRLTEEIAGRARERIAKETAEADTKRLTEGNKWLIDALSTEARAKEAAQKELALAGNVAKCLREELKHAQDSAAGNYSAYCDSMSQLSTAQKELAEALRYIAEIHALSRPPLSRPRKP